MYYHHQHSQSTPKDPEGAQGRSLDLLSHRFCYSEEAANLPSYARIVIFIVVTYRP